MKTCIICRKPKKTFSDEHVIPDSIDGFYHIYSVCVECNSKMGNNIDSKLVNHKFIEFQRHSLKIKGKSGSIPNPFAGVQTLKDDPNQKVIVNFNEKGQMITKLLPKIPNLKDKKNIKSISFSIDIQDLHLKDKIIEKIINRNGLDKSNITFQKLKEKQSKPWIQTSMSVDIKNFRIGLLKIAYEFAVDTFEDYFNDPMAIIISEILFKCDIERMERENILLGNGLEKETQKPLSHLINFENKNHYLILMEIESIGLVCQVNIFDCFSIWIKLSDSFIYLDKDIIVGINDIENKKFEKLNGYEIINRTFSKPEYRFQYFLPDEETLLNFIELQNRSDFDYYSKDGNIPFFDRFNNIKYLNLDLKLKQDQLIKIPKGDAINESHTQILLDEELFIKIYPTMELYQVVSVQIESYRLNKI